MKKKIKEHNICIVVTVASAVTSHNLIIIAFPSQRSFFLPTLCHQLTVLYLVAHNFRIVSESSVFQCLLSCHSSPFRLDMGVPRAAQRVPGLQIWSSSARCVPAGLSECSSHWPNPPGSYWKANLLEMQTVRLLRHRAEKSRRGMQNPRHR